MVSHDLIIIIHIILAGCGELIIMLLGQVLTHKQTTYYVIMGLYHGIVLWVDFFISNQHQHRSTHHFLLH